ncbi:MAG: hypothetical protein FWD60_07750 [Candidatus Azobacteroides sp.]|nr:hypothetical protein [Candidatus Azobacteroides sp.]
MKVLWTAFAEKQLDSIYDYLQNINLYKAIGIYNDILDGTGKCAFVPHNDWTSSFEFHYNFKKTIFHFGTVFL